MTSATVTKDERAGAAVYNPATLAAYNIFVLQVTNSYGWRCTRESQLDLYNQHLSGNHLDIGPGTGWYLENVALPPGDLRWGGPTAALPTITLFDLNQTTLSRTTRLLAQRGIQAHSRVGSVLQPIPRDIGLFDSVASHFVFHCVPGSWEGAKGDAISHIASIVSDDGVFFGTTVLGDSADHNLFGKILMAIYNGRSGVFHNRADTEAGLTQALERAFEEVDVQIEGVVAKFVARKPRR